MKDLPYAIMDDESFQNWPLSWQQLGRPTSGWAQEVKLLEKLGITPQAKKEFVDVYVIGPFGQAAWLHGHKDGSYGGLLSHLTRHEIDRLSAERKQLMRAGLEKGEDVTLLAFVFEDYEMPFLAEAREVGYRPIELEVQTTE